MLFRFCLYGFLKNQQYYEPFIILAFREKGLSFFAIGLLVMTREVVTNICEIPSGAVADLYGRRRCMILSFLGYIVSFAILGSATTFPLLVLGMAVFGVGDAFRTGTHKAMIMHWLRVEGRLAEKTEVYGRTRSWSRLGSAVSALVAAALVFRSGRYGDIFFWTIGPYLVGICNFLGYPAYLDQELEGRSENGVTGHLRAALRTAWDVRELRGLLFETMAWDGIYKAVKGYLQPVVKSAAVALPLLVAFEGHQRTALLIGVVYFSFHVLESRASRYAHRVQVRCGGEVQAAWWLWRLRCGTYAAVTVGLAAELHLAAIAAFVTLGVLHNVWRPIQVGRMQTHAPGGQSATILSVDSQAGTVATMLAAPLLGLAVDHVGLTAVGVVGLVVCAARLAFGPRTA